MRVKKATEKEVRFEKMDEVLYFTAANHFLKTNKLAIYAEKWADGYKAQRQSLLSVWFLDASLSKLSFPATASTISFSCFKTALTISLFPFPLLNVACSPTGLTG